MIIEDSISPEGVRLTTLQLKYQRFIHGEFMTHRVFSRNASSSRAIPIDKEITGIINDTATPIHWGVNKAGMQADSEIADIVQAKQIWLEARDAAIYHARKLQALNVHKQVVNRLLEPFVNIHVVVTATEWENFFNLRLDAAAQPEIQHLAKSMLQDMYGSKPKELTPGQWHLPYVSQEERNQHPPHILVKLSTARCARVSYLNHDQSNPDYSKDIKLHDDLLRMKHMSPFEHAAAPQRGGFYANLRGWRSYRNTLELT
jgi:thymidylate synthase ThyX